VIIYHSKFLEVNYLELQYLMHFRWSRFAAYMDREGIYYETARFAEKRVKRRADQIYLDWRHISHLIEPETLPWLEEYIFPKIFSHHPHKLGILLEKLPDFSLPGHIRLNEKDIPVRVFTSPEKLTAWLMEGARRKDPGDHDHHHGSCSVD